MKTVFEKQAEIGIKTAYKGVFWIKEKSEVVAAIIPCFPSGVVPSRYNWIESAITRKGDSYTFRGAWRMIDDSITERHSFSYYPRGLVNIKDGRATIYCVPSIFDDTHIEAVKKAFSLNPYCGIIDIVVKLGR